VHGCGNRETVKPCAKHARRRLDQHRDRQYRVASMELETFFSLPRSYSYETQIIIDESMIEYCKSGISGIFLLISDGCHGSWFMIDIGGNIV
jgi:hypothetical protein